MFDLFNPFSRLAASSAALAVEANSVIGLRLFAMATGAGSDRENRRMVSEKTAAFVEAQMEVATSLMLGQGHLAPARVVKLYRRKVRANRRRLTTG